MSYVVKINDDIKKAMLAKDKIRLNALRAVKAAFLLEQTKSESNELLDEKAVQIMQKLLKQRNESAEIYIAQKREDLSQTEIAEAEIISEYLPEPMSEEQIEKIILKLIDDTGASGMKDMGKVMGIASKQLAGKADGRQISSIVKKVLS